MARTSPTAAASNGTPAKERIRISRACDICRAKKIRCTGTRPCQRCANECEICEYNTPYERGKNKRKRVRLGLHTPPSTASPTSISTHQEGNDYSQQTHSHNANGNIDAFVGDALLPASTCAPNASGAMDSSSRASPEPGERDLQGHFVGASSGVAFLLRLQRRLRQDAGSVAETSVFTLGDAVLPEFDELSFELPPRDEAESLLKTYFELSSPTYRFLHRPTVESWMRELYESGTISGRRSRSKYAVVLTVLAQAVRYTGRWSNTHHAHSGVEYFQAAEQQLDRETESATLTSIQALLGSCFYVLTRSRLNHCWTLFGTTARLIQALGLHRKKTKFNGGAGDGDGIEIECRKRLFWCAYNLDKYLSAIFGRPCAFNDDDIDQDMPALVEDHELTAEGMVVARANNMNVMLGPLNHQRLGRILSKILRRLYGIKPLDRAARHQVISEIGAEIDSWRDDLPAFLNPEKVDSRLLKPLFQRQSNLLTIASGHARILLYRPCFFSDHPPTSERLGTQANVQKCVDAAMSIVEVVDRMVEANQFYAASWFAHYQAFSAVVVLYTYTIRSSRGQEEVAERMKYLAAAERCQGQIVKVAGMDTLAQRFHVIMEEFRLEVVRLLQGDEGLPPHNTMGASGVEQQDVQGAVLPESEVAGWFWNSQPDPMGILDLQNWEQLDSLMTPKEQIIASVEPLHVGQFMFCRITTNHGIVGYGEAGIWGHIEAAATCIKRFAEYLVGKRAFDIEHHWNVMHRFSYFQGLAINAAISSIDIALWDIKGKALGVPIYELLGGACRTKARVYGHIYESTIEKVLEECKRKMDLGFTAFGHINPFLDEGVDKVYFKTHVKKMEDAIDNVKRMREVVGEKVDLLIELHRRLTPAEAITFCEGIKDTHPMLVEDPIRPENADAMARVAHRIPVPVGTGERFCTIYEFQALLSRDAVEYARVDVAVCGGITGAKKVAAMAEAHHVQVVPHNPLSPIGLAACLQIAAAIPNFAIQEYATGFEAGVFESKTEHLGSDVVDYVPVPVEGFVDIPPGPGLGMNLVENAQEVRPPLVQPIKMRPHRDGFIVDQ